MAELVITNAYISVNAVDLSGKGRDLGFSRTREGQDTTDFGSAGSHERLPGLRDSQLDIEFNQDFASGSVDATLHAAYESDAAVVLEIRPVNANRSSTNPGYTGSFICTSYQPFGNSVGEAARARATFQQASAIARSTS
jgi:hypothetical protein